MLSLAKMLAERALNFLQARAEEYNIGPFLLAPLMTWAVSSKEAALLTGALAASGEWLARNNPRSPEEGRLLQTAAMLVPPFLVAVQLLNGASINHPQEVAISFFAMIGAGALSRVSTWGWEKPSARWVALTDVAYGASFLSLMTFALGR